MFDYEFWLSIAVLVLSCLAFLITFVRTGSLKKAIKNFSEVNMVKYRTMATREKTAPSPQEFSEFEDDYVLNPDTNELEKLPIQKNIQAKIDSYLECALEKALERFLPQNVSEVDDVREDYSKSVEDLGSLGAAMEAAEEYRERFNLPDNYSLSDIYDFVDKHAKELKVKLSEFNKPVKEEEKNGSQTSSESSL